MLKKLSSILLEISTTVPETDATTTSNPLLNEDGQFEEPSQIIENFASLWEEFNLVGKITEKLPTIIVAVITLVIGFLLAKFISNLAVKAMQAKNVDPSVYNFIRRIISVGIKFVFILTAISMFFDVAAIFAAVGAAGITAGLGLQDSVAQFASGIQILINHPFKSGDFVELNGISGSVTDIRFMNTVITTSDNKRIVIPNSHITTNHIINYTAENKRRIDLIFSISYSDDIAKAKNIIKNVALSHDKIHKTPDVEVYVNSYEASSINLVVKFWCNNEDYWGIYYSMQEKVKTALDSNNITIPFNQIDVHIINN